MIQALCQAAPLSKGAPSDCRMVQDGEELNLVLTAFNESTVWLSPNSHALLCFETRDCVDVFFLSAAQHLVKMCLLSFVVVTGVMQALLKLAYHCISWYGFPAQLPVIATSEMYNSSADWLASVHTVAVPDSALKLVVPEVCPLRLFI